MKHIVHTSLLFIAMLLIAACSKSPSTAPSEPPPKSSVIAGRIIDAGQSPIANAKVRILNTQFSATTAPDGTYQLQFIPGQFSVRAEAAQHVPAEKSFNVSVATTVPAEDIMLIALDNTQLEQMLSKTLNDFTAKTYWGTFPLKRFAKIDSVTCKTEGTGSQVNVLCTINLTMISDIVGTDGPAGDALRQILGGVPHSAGEKVVREIGFSMPYDFDKHTWMFPGF